MSLEEILDVDLSEVAGIEESSMNGHKGLKELKMSLVSEVVDRKLGRIASEEERTQEDLDKWAGEDLIAQVIGGHLDREHLAAGPPRRDYGPRWADEDEWQRFWDEASEKNPEALRSWGSAVRYFKNWLDKYLG